MSEEPIATPLLELLERVPEDARATYEHHSTMHSMIPYGLLCAKAAKAIRDLERQNQHTIQSQIDQLTLQGIYPTIQAEVTGTCSVVLLGWKENVDSQHEVDLFMDVATALEWATERAKSMQKMP